MAMPNVKILVSSHRLGDLGVTYTVHLWLVGKRVVDFLLVLVEQTELSYLSRTRLHRRRPHWDDSVEVSSRSLASENYRVPRLSYCVDCVILLLAVLIQYWLVTD